MQTCSQWTDPTLAVKGLGCTMHTDCYVSSTHLAEPCNKPCWNFWCYILMSVLEMQNMSYPDKGPFKRTLFKTAFIDMGKDRWQGKVTFRGSWVTQKINIISTTSQQGNETHVLHEWQARLSNAERVGSLCVGPCIKGMKVHNVTGIKIVETPDH